MRSQAINAVHILDDRITEIRREAGPKLGTFSFASEDEREAHLERLRIVRWLQRNGGLPAYIPEYFWHHEVYGGIVVVAPKEHAHV